MECGDFCEELGRKAEAERKEREAMFAQGYQKRVQYEQQGIRSVSLHTNTHAHTLCLYTHTTRSHTKTHSLSFSLLCPNYCMLLVV